ncbi:hypothetical protein F4859DRAFT_509745 [Xylaria cf. heliscus]|nr:hypothetical protein F4859DRAFT_509745 [Xylaria cf. heliscus]
MPNSPGKDTPTVHIMEDKGIDLVKLANNPHPNYEPKAEPNSLEKPVLLKPPKAPKVQLAFPHGFTTPKEDRRWRHELEFGFGDIWTEYAVRYAYKKPESITGSNPIDSWINGDVSVQ